MVGLQSGSLTGSRLFGDFAAECGHKRHDFSQPQVLSADQLFQSGAKGGPGSPQDLRLKRITRNQATLQKAAESVIERPYHLRNCLSSPDLLDAPSGCIRDIRGRLEQVVGDKARHAFLETSFAPPRSKMRKSRLSRLTKEVAWAQSYKRHFDPELVGSLNLIGAGTDALQAIQRAAALKDEAVRAAEEEDRKNFSRIGGAKTRMFAATATDLVSMPGYRPPTPPREPEAIVKEAMTLLHKWKLHQEIRVAPNLLPGMATAHVRTPWTNSWQRWYTFTSFDGLMVRVELRGQGVCDADLPSLFRHVGFRLQEAGRSYALDLSDNAGITDYGVTTSLVPFLRQWPQCSSLKLARTAIGDMSLQALADWMSNSFVSEVDLSQVGGSITSKVAVDTLQRVISRRKALHKDSCDADAKLWLCLELNSIEGVETALTHANVWDRSCAGWKRRSTCKANKIPVIELSLYPSVPEPHPSNRGKEILSILRGSSSTRSVVEPLALSVDEFQLYCMEAREAAEAGADRKNHETFGKDSVVDGWSFERNIEANHLLKNTVRVPSRTVVTVLKNPKGHESREKDKPEKKEKKEKKDRKDKHEKRTDSPQNAAKSAVDGAVRSILKSTSVLHASDFRGNVREWLVAIHRTGGNKGVAEAAELIHTTVAGKRREDVTKWTGYLSKLLERFHTQLRPTVVQLQ
ncbi:unnamed protein product [Symbiodinium sp. CCMP2456]|nr:unnamed protein product [Symbiodinium sp. CCMP2456]